MPISEGRPAVEGLRERKKVETRQALQQAAHSLFAQHGFAATTIDDITSAVNVSRRTFFRYFSSKEDLLRVDIADLLPSMLAELGRRPADESPLASILAALMSLVGPHGPPALAGSLTAPLGGIRARIGLLRVLATWEDGITETLLERWGFSAAEAPQELRVRASVTACAATSALRSSVQIYRAAHDAPGLDLAALLPIIGASFAVLQDGCSNPT